MPVRRVARLHAARVLRWGIVVAAVSAGQPKDWKIALAERVPGGADPGHPRRFVMARWSDGVLPARAEAQEE